MGFDGFKGWLIDGIAAGDVVQSVVDVGIEAVERNDDGAVGCEVVAKDVDGIEEGDPAVDLPTLLGRKGRE